MSCSKPSLPVYHQLLEFAQTHVHRVSDAIHHPLSFSSCLQSFPASGSFPVSHFFVSSGQSIGASASNISPSNEYSGLISFRIDWLELLAVQGTLKNLLQHQSLKASFLQHSAFLMVQLSYPYMTTGKTIGLTIRTFASKVMSLLFNTLSRFVVALLPGSKCLLISWLQLPSAVISEPKTMKSDAASAFSSSSNLHLYQQCLLGTNFKISLRALD